MVVPSRPGTAAGHQKQALLDQASDTGGQLLHRLVAVCPPPDFVKNASRERWAGTPQQQASSYAHPPWRLWPCHTAEATWLSAGYFQTQKQAMDPAVATVVEARIDAAARHHGIAALVDQIKSAMTRAASTSETELPDDAFALVFDDGNGHKERHYPLRNAPEVQKAASWVAAEAGEFVRADRQALARRVLDKSAQLQAPLPPPVQTSLEKLAAPGRCSAATLARVLCGRAALLKQSAARVPGCTELAANLEKIAAEVQQCPSVAHNPESVERMVHMLDRVDREFGLRAGGLPLPEEDLFTVTPAKVASLRADHVALASGLVYRADDLAGLSPDAVRSLLGARLADSVTSGLWVDSEKCAAVLPSLPVADARLFDTLAHQSGIAPVYKQASTTPALSAEALARLAAQHRPRG